ncbi:MAG: thioredoxin fold domain-containing protein [Chloroflexota bacterium]
MTSQRHSKRKKSSHKRSFPPSLLILGGLVLLVVAVFFLKRDTGNNVEVPLSLEAQLDAALQEKRPTFIFLHSLDCIPCKEMMEVVAQVYPEFQEQVVLIDVDVYEQRNANILRREGLQAIPTLVFYDSTGERYMHVGVLPAEQMRTVLQNLSGEN